MKHQKIEFSIAEIKDRRHLRWREREHHLGESLEKRRTVAYPLVLAWSYALGSPRGSSSVTSWTAWGPYASVTPVATTPKGSHGASYARPGERETEAERSGKIKKDGVGKGNRENVSRKREEGDRREEEKGRNIRGRPKGQRSGEPASSRSIKVWKSVALRRRSLSLLHDATYYSNRNAGPQGSSARGRQREESMASKDGGEGQGRADSRGRETFQSLVASLPGWLAGWLAARLPACLPARLPVRLPACLFARLSARRLPSHRHKASFVECHTDHHNRIEPSWALSRPTDFYSELTIICIIERICQKRDCKRAARENDKLIRDAMSSV